MIVCRAWHEEEWTSSDDRVRGGKSCSALSCSPGSLVARFHGNLDITALGGAGFASQRTTDMIRHNDNGDGKKGHKHHKHHQHHQDHDRDGDDDDDENPKTWDLSNYDGLELVINKADTKTYTLTLKNDILPRRPDGREQSTLSWEYDFQADSPNKPCRIFVHWDEFRPTYRGKEIPDAEPLDLKRIRRFGIMVRRYVSLPPFFHIFPFFWFNVCF